jgi:hypothetical protein
VHRIQVGGDDQLLSATFTNAGVVRLGSISWISSDSGVATITPTSSTGAQALLHAVHKGLATITVTAAGGTLVHALSLQVLPANQPAVLIEVETPGSTAPNDPDSGLGGHIPGGGDTPQ